MNSQGSNRMQVVNTNFSWPFRADEGELKECLLGGSSSGTLGSGLYMWDYLYDISELPLGDIREYAQGLQRFSIIISARVSRMGVQFDTKKNNFSLEKERLDDSCLKISEEPSCGRKHKLDLCDSRGKN